MKSKKLALLAIKYIPIIMSAIMLAHALLGLFGIDLPFTENTAHMSILPTLTILLVSHAFGFCKLHKAFTIYVLINSCLFDYHRTVCDTAHLYEHRFCSAVAGIILFAILFKRRKVCNKICCDYDNEDDK